MLALYRFEREGLRRWPRFVRDLEKASRCSVGYRDEGTLIVAADRDDAEACPSAQMGSPVAPAIT